MSTKPTSAEAAWPAALRSKQQTRKGDSRQDLRCRNASVAADIASTGFLNFLRFAGCH